MSNVMLVVSVEMRNIHHCRGDGLMLLNCNGLIPVTYSFNGGWLAMMRPGSTTNPCFLASFPFIPTMSLDETNCEQCGWVSLEKVCVYLRVNEKPTALNKRMNYNNASLRVGVISLIPDHGNPLSEHHCRAIHVDLVGREYRNVIDGE
ncbi:hypothetical protein AAG906_003494 [Vitis piasezkii]